MTVTSPELDDLVWSDGTVKSADSGFPLAITLADDTVVEEVKVFLCATEDPSGYVLVVYDKGIGTGPRLMLVDRVVEIIEMGKTRRMELESHGIVEYANSRKCGCGSRLRSFNPWRQTARVVGVPRPNAPWTAQS